MLNIKNCIIALWISTSSLTYSEEVAIDLSAYGEPIEIKSKVKVRTDNALTREICAFIDKHDAYNAVLISFDAPNFYLDPKDRDKFGRNFVLIAEASVPQNIVNLYTSIVSIPDMASTVRILYSQDEKRKVGVLLGYLIENKEGDYIKVVYYDRNTPYLEWVKKSFTQDDA